MTRSYVHPLHFLAQYFLHPALAQWFRNFAGPVFARTFAAQ
jgi:hypothetical protein